MKSIQYHRYGGPHELRLETVALPSPGAGQIRVRIRAAAANPMDWKIRRGELKLFTGKTFPRGLGHDFAGIIDAVGPGVTRLHPGDEVFGATDLKDAGAFAEALVADEKTVFEKPRSLSFEEAAAMPVVTAAAWTALITQARLRAGQHVLIAGCLGSVGRMAVQIARMHGARIAGSCSAERRDEALALGVEEVHDYRALDAASLRRRFDIVFDTHGALSLGECGRMLKPGGVAEHLVPTGAKMLWALLSPRHQTVFAKLPFETMSAIAAAADKGELRPTIERVVPLSRAIDALVALETAVSPRGKLVVTPD